MFARYIKSRDHLSLAMDSIYENTQGECQSDTSILPSTDAAIMITCDGFPELSLESSVLGVGVDIASLVGVPFGGEGAVYSDAHCMRSELNTIVESSGSVMFRPPHAMS